MSAVVQMLSRMIKHDQTDKAQSTKVCKRENFCNQTMFDRVFHP